VPLNYTASLATTNCGSLWLQATNANSTLTGVTDDTLTVSVAVAGLVSATCNGTITINATNPATGAAAVNSPLTIPVTLYVSSSALLVRRLPILPVYRRRGRAIPRAAEHHPYQHQLRRVELHSRVPNHQRW
jgi:hypothetical protein